MTNASYLLVSCSQENINKWNKMRVMCVSCKFARNQHIYIEMCKKKTKVKTNDEENKILQRIYDNRVYCVHLVLRIFRNFNHSLISFHIRFKWQLHTTFYHHAIFSIRFSFSRSVFFFLLSFNTHRNRFI